MHPDRITFRAHKPLVLAVLATCAAALVSIPVTAAPPAAKKAAAKAAAGGTTTNDANKSGVQSFRGEVAPAMPTNVTVMPLTRRGFQIRWKDNSPNEVAYEIERVPAFSGGVIRLGANVTSYLDTQNLASAQYRVRARGDTLTSDWTGLMQGSSVASTFVALPNGPGFSGGTTVFAVGTAGMPGYDAKAIARWDVVPYQTFNGDFLVGVVAFHMNGIDRVEFTANGGETKSVTEMKLNPQTNVWEYTALLRASDFADGAVEVRAVVYPKDAGIPRVLGGSLDAVSVPGEHSMFLFANSQGTLPARTAFVNSTTGSDATGNGSSSAPYKSIMKAAVAIQIANGGANADGGTIFLQAGNHPWGPAERDADGRYIGRPTEVSRWLTVQPAPGVSRDSVIIVPADYSGLKTDLLCVKDVTFHTGISNAIPSNAKTKLWIDNCLLEGTGPGSMGGWTSYGWNSGLWATDTSIRQCESGLTVGANLARNVDVSDVASDGFDNPGCLINCSVTRAIETGSYHSDAIQYDATTPGIHNTVIYGFRAIDCQATGWYIGYSGHTKGEDWSDMAFVNAVFDATHTQQWHISANHVLWWNFTVTDGAVEILDNLTTGGGHGELTTIRNFDMRQSVFHQFSLRSGQQAPNLTDTGWSRENHFMESGSIASAGADATTGGTLASIFVNAAGNDFRLRSDVMPGSRSVSALSPVNVLCERRSPFTSIGAAGSNAAGN